MSNVSVCDWSVLEVARPYPLDAPNSVTSTSKRVTSLSLHQAGNALIGSCALCIILNAESCLIQLLRGDCESDGQNYRRLEGLLRCGREMRLSCFASYGTLQYEVLSPKLDTMQHVRYPLTKTATVEYSERAEYNLYLYCIEVFPNEKLSHCNHEMRLWTTT